MICAVAGLIAQGTTIVEKTECVETSFPAFVEIMNALTKEPHITIS
jgi:5-enolpyruvylshikimate-3-phosphate synthase